MKKLLVIPAVVGGLLIGAPQAFAHCDSLGGPVAGAAMEALESGNVNPVLAYAPESAAHEMRDVFEQAVAVRAAGGEAKALATTTSSRPPYGCTAPAKARPTPA